MRPKQVETIQVLTSGKQKFLLLPAKVSLQNVYKAPQIHELLRRSLHRLSWQLRDEIIVERSILSPAIAPEWIASLLALGAQVVFSEETQNTPLEDFLPRVGPHSGKITALRITQGVPGRVWAEEHVSTAPSAAPIVSVIAVVDLLEGMVHQARLALTGVWRENARLADAMQTLAGGPLNSESIQRVTKAVEAEVAPQGDFLGSSDYRRSMSAVLTRRVLDQCRIYAEEWI